MKATGTHGDQANKITVIELNMTDPRATLPFLKMNPKEEMTMAAINPPKPVIASKYPPTSGPAFNTSTVNIGNMNHTGWSNTLGISPKIIRWKITFSCFLMYRKPSSKSANGEPPELAGRGWV